MRTNRRPKMAELSAVSELVETERVVSAFGFIPNVSTDTFSLIVGLVMRRRYQRVSGDTRRREHRHVLVDWDVLVRPEYAVRGECAYHLRLAILSCGAQVAKRPSHGPSESVLSILTEVADGACAT
jgi:hypothetical protein